MLGRPASRPLATSLLLAAASAACVALVWLRIDRTGTGEYGFLVWNLFLAWLPLVVAAVLHAAWRRRVPGSLLLALCLFWLLFFPNAPYIVTDVVHLAEPAAAPLWYDALTVLAFAATGLLLGFCSLLLVHAVATDAFGPAAGWLASAAALALASVGIYLGRFVGVNSWDVVADPGRVLAPFVERAQDPLGAGRFLAVSGVLAVLLLVGYAAFYAVARAAPVAARR